MHERPTHVSCGQIEVAPEKGHLESLLLGLRGVETAASDDGQVLKWLLQGRVKCALQIVGWVVLFFSSP